MMYTTYVNTAESDRRRPDRGGACAALRKRHLALSEFVLLAAVNGTAV